MSKAINNLLNGSKGLLEKYGYVEEERPVVKKRVNEGLNEGVHDLNYFKDCAFKGLKNYLSKNIKDILNGKYIPGFKEELIKYCVMDSADAAGIFARDGAQFMHMLEPDNMQRGSEIRGEYFSLTGEGKQHYSNYGKALQPFFKGKELVDFIDVSENDKIAIVKELLIAILKINAQGFNDVRDWPTGKKYPISLDDANKIGEAFGLTFPQVADILNSTDFIKAKNSIEADKRKRDAAAAKRAEKPVIKKKSKIVRLFNGDPKYFDEAEDIIQDWYYAEDNIDGIKNPDLDDILDMLDAATDSDERQTVAKAIGDATAFVLEDDDEEDLDESLNESDTGSYGEQIFNMLDKLSGDQLIDFINYYKLPFNSNSVDEIYKSIHDYLESSSGEALYSKLDDYFALHNIDENLNESESDTFELDIIIEDDAPEIEHSELLKDFKAYNLENLGEKEFSDVVKYLLKGSKKDIRSLASKLRKYGRTIEVKDPSDFDLADYWDLDENLNEFLDKDKAQYILSNVFYQNGKIDKVDYNELLDLMDESESAFGKRLVELGIKNDFYKELKKDENLNEASVGDTISPEEDIQDLGFVIKCKPSNLYLRDIENEEDIDTGYDDAWTNFLEEAWLFKTEKEARKEIAIVRDENEERGFEPNDFVIIALSKLTIQKIDRMSPLKESSEYDGIDYDPYDDSDTTPGDITGIKTIRRGPIQGISLNTPGTPRYVPLKTKDKSPLDFKPESKIDYRIFREQDRMDSFLKSNPRISNTIMRAIGYAMFELSADAYLQKDIEYDYIYIFSKDKPENYVMIAASRAGKDFIDGYRPSNPKANEYHIRKRYGIDQNLLDYIKQELTR